MTGRRLRSPVAALLAGLAAACSHTPPAPTWQSIDVRAAATPLFPDRPEDRRIGDLTFRGGLVLDSDAPQFGGFSGLVVDAQGRLTAVSDQGSWLSARLSFDARTGDLVGLTQTRMAALRNERGEPLAPNRQTDAEELTRLPDGRFAVSFEQDHRILIYDLTGKGPAAPATPGPPVALPEGALDNEGLEALTALPDGRLVALEEFPPAGAGTPFWVFSGDATTAPAPAGRAERPAGYGMSGLARLPTGDLAGLERFYQARSSVLRINVRLIPVAGLTATPATVDGPVVATLEAPATVDNFEAVAAVAGDRPDMVRLYIMSDDNFSSAQRTLLLAFDLALPDHAAPVRRRGR